jgi:hypothetical protein
MTLERPPVTEPIKQAIRDAFAIVPEGKTTAIVAIYDIEAKGVSTLRPRSANTGASEAGSGSRKRSARPE